MTAVGVIPHCIRNGLGIIWCIGHGERDTATCGAGVIAIVMIFKLKALGVLKSPVYLIVFIIIHLKRASGLTCAVPVMRTVH